MKNYKLYSLKKINRFTKALNMLKQKAYDDEEYEKCRKYKLTQTYLYILKTLSIVDMLEKNELKIIKKFNHQYPENIITFTLISDEKETVFFNLINLEAEDSPIDEDIFSDEINLNIKDFNLIGINVFINYLYKHLSINSKTIIEFLWKEESPYMFLIDINGIVDCLENLSNLNLKVKLEYHDCILGTCTDIYKCGIFFKNFKLSTFEFRVDDEHVLKVKDNDLYLSDGLEYDEI